jgi:hypothetical protein
MLDVVMLNVIMLNVIMLNVIMLNAIMLNVIMLNVIMMIVIMLNVIMLNVVAQFLRQISSLPLQAYELGLIFRHFCSFLGNCDKFYFTFKCEFEYFRNSRRTKYLFTIYRTCRILIPINQ